MKVQIFTISTPASAVPRSLLVGGAGVLENRPLNAPAQTSGSGELGDMPTIFFFSFCNHVTGMIELVRLHF